MMSLNRNVEKSTANIQLRLKNIKIEVKIKKIICKKNELLKRKKIERIVATMKAKRDKKGKQSEIDKVKSIGMGISKTYDHFAHQRPLFNYERSLSI